MNTTSLPVHLYAATIANSDQWVGKMIHLSLPMKYYELYADAAMEGFVPVTNKGSVQLFFKCNHTTASAIRKWLDRRFNGKRDRLSLDGRKRRDLKFARCVECGNQTAFRPVGA